MSNEWHKSSYSNGGTNCVEVREHTRGADVRDTTRREHETLTFATNEWAAFLHDVQAARL